MKTTKNENLQATISRVIIRSDEKPSIPKKANYKIINCSHLPYTDEWITCIQLNEICKEMKSYSSFKTVFQNCFCDLKISEYSFYGINIRLGCLPTNVEKNIKLNLLMMNLFEATLISEKTQDYYSDYSVYDNALHVLIDNNCWGMSYHNKPIENASTTQTYIEFRKYLKPTNGIIKPHHIKNMWFKKLEELIEMYDIAKSGGEYSDCCIYTQHLLNYISYSDVKEYISKIKAALTEYFNS